MVPGLVQADRWSDRFGPLRATFECLCLFSVGLLLAGLAAHLPARVAGRVLQSRGGAMLWVAL